MNKILQSSPDGLTLIESYMRTTIPMVEILCYHVKTIWLFTFSDLKTIIGPKTAFGVITALSGAVLTKNDEPDLRFVLSQIPITAYWTWINLLPFAIDNQRRPEAIKEDSENKPWRAIPSKRLSEEKAKYLMFSLYPAALISSFYLGGFKQCIALILLGFWYNDLGGADNNCFVRNLINACGFVCYASGTTEVVCQATLSESPFKPIASKWFLLIAAVVFSSVQTQDMYDQAGDCARGRQTVPLLIGDTLARWTIAIPVALWSYVCPRFWELGLVGHGVPTILASVLIFRTLSKKTVEADKLTFRLWNLWMVTIYLLPLLRRVKGDSWL